MNDPIHTGDFFPEVLESATTMQNYFLALGAIILFAGLVFRLGKAEAITPARIVQLLTTTGLTVMAMKFSPDFVDHSQLFFHELSQGMGSDPSRTGEQFLELLAAEGGKDDDGDTGFWDLLTMDGGGIGVALIYALVSLTGYIAFAVMFLYRLAQQVIIIYAIVVSPLMFSFFHFDITKGAATKFFTSLLAIAMWPLGWALCDLVTQHLLRLAVHEHIYEEAGEGLLISGSVFFFFMITISLWVLASTIAAPKKIAQLIEDGSQFGSGIIRSFSSAFAQHFTYGAAAAVSSKELAGASTATSMTIGSAAGLGGAITASAETNNVIIPAAIGLIGTMGVSKDLKQNLDNGEERQ